MDAQGIVVHHSASGVSIDANDIDRWHKERGWKGVGYHFVITVDGTIQPARNFESVGAHKRGYNDTHIGICLVGDFTKHAPTSRQIDSLIKLSKGIISRWDLKEVIQHHENCPGNKFPWNYFKAQINL